MAVSIRTAKTLKREMLELEEREGFDWILEILDEEKYIFETI